MTFVTHGADLNVTLVNPNTKQAQSMINRYINTRRGDSIWKAYQKPSSRKVQAFQEILKEMNEVDGWGMRITGAGSDIFSCAYLVMNENDEKYLIYHTPSNRFAIKYNV